MNINISNIITAIPAVSQHPDRDALIIRLLHETGARVSEVIEFARTGLKGKNIIVLPVIGTSRHYLRDDKTIRSEKNTSAVKEYRVSHSLYEELRRYISQSNTQTYVFESNRSKLKHISRWYVWWILGKASEHAGIRITGKHDIRTGSREKGIYPHVFRNMKRGKV